MIKFKHTSATQPYPDSTKPQAKPTLTQSSTSASTVYGLLFTRPTSPSLSSDIHTPLVPVPWQTNLYEFTTLSCLLWLAYNSRSSNLLFYVLFAAFSIVCLELFAMVDYVPRIYTSSSSFQYDPAHRSELSRANAIVPFFALLSLATLGLTILPSKRIFQLCLILLTMHYVHKILLPLFGKCCQALRATHSSFTSIASHSLTELPTFTCSLLLASLFHSPFLCLAYPLSRIGTFLVESLRDYLALTNSDDPLQAQSGLAGWLTRTFALRNFLPASFDAGGYLDLLGGLIFCLASYTLYVLFM